MNFTFKKKPLFINGKVVYEYILSEEAMPLYYGGGFFKTIQINDVDEFINVVLSSDDATHITLNNLNIIFSPIFYIFWSRFLPFSFNKLTVGKIA